MKQFILCFAMIIALTTCTTSKKGSKPAPAASLTETYWRAFEIMGKPVMAPNDKQSEVHMILKKEGGRVQGNDGCNTISGVYELKDPGRISFSKMISTLMACPNMDNDANLSKVFESADSYYLNGDTLQLIRARMAPLAKFKAVNMK